MGYFVQGNSGGSTAAEASQAVAFPAANQGGNFLVVYFCWSGAGTLASTLPTDTLGNTYTQLYNNGNADQSAIYVVYGCKAGANTITCALTGGTSNPTGMIICEFGGMAPYGVYGLDVAFSQVVTTQTAGTTVTTPAITNVWEYDLILAFFQGVDGTAVAPFSLAAPVTVALDCIEYNFVNVVGSSTASNSSATGGFVSMGILAIRAAGYPNFGALGMS
jgi:hypothetical protein